MKDIYIKIDCDDSSSNSITWLNHTESTGESYLLDDKNGDGFLDDGETPCGSPFKPSEAKRWASKGKSLARFDGGIKPKVTFWILNNWKYQQVKIDAAGKILLVKAR